MKVTYPLSLKVSVWLLLNLLLPAALGFGFLVVQGGLGWNALVAGPGGARAQSRANVIAGEAAAANTEDRQAVLDRFGAAYGAKFRLLRNEEAARGLAELPAEVRARLEFRPLGRAGFGGGRGKFGPGLGDVRRPPVGEFDPPPKREPGEKAKREPGEGVRREPPTEQTAERVFGRFVVRTETPSAYWVGLRVMIVPPDRTPERSRFGGPAYLLAEVGSLWTLLSFLDHQSWLLAGTAVLALSVLFWLPLVRGITGAIGQLTAATEQIADGRFDTRVPDDRRDELGQLGASVNRMATRLDAHMTGQKRFLGDVAHELCSPLARLQMATGILAERAPAELHPTVTDVREEVQQMSTLVNELLAFTKAGLQRREVVLTRVALAPMVQAVIAREGGGGRTTAIVAPELHVTAEPDLLARALSNLVRNALRYSDATEAVVVSARREGDRVVIAVDDSGPGVPPEAINRLGEPFFRPEAARTRELGGVGLGLSIVRSAMVSCGGEVHFSNRTPHGFRAEIILAAA